MNAEEAFNSIVEILKPPATSATDGSYFIYLPRDGELESKWCMTQCQVQDDSGQDVLIHIVESETIEYNRYSTFEQFVDYVEAFNSWYETKEGDAPRLIDYSIAYGPYFNLSGEG